ncbi:MAG TPA: hypothetical protein PKY59_12450 [Pyrinomonadaceae bacterium]|nr:hypothetical protein [Pyrinomonadaceae bacterium]
MQNLKFQNGNVKEFTGGIKIIPILFIWLIVFVIGLTFLIYNDDELNPVKENYLLPWILATGVLLTIPSIILWYQGKFKFYNPLIFATWSYFFPAFVLGGIILSNGWSSPFFLSFIQDPKNDLPFTMLIVILGYAGLAIGYFLPVGNRLGKMIGDVLPIWNWNPEKLRLAGFILLVIGLFNTVLGYFSGVLGYQKLTEIGAFDGIIFLMTLIWLEASFLLWLLLFKRNILDLSAVFTASVLLITSLAKALYAGNRGSLLTIFIMVMLAFLMSGRRVGVKQATIGGVILVLCIILGMIYGTTFRNIKESEAQVGFEQYTENIFQTFETVSETDNLKTLELGFLSLAERLDAVSSLAVVVSNYEQLAPYEEGYGLDNNIWKDTVTFFIPRVIWQDKPLASEPRKYSELYFNYGENSFTITPMGDLLRNYGVYGVFFGMVILGMILRFLFASLVENREFSFWRTVLYFMLLTAISYESFYGSIIPYITKVGFISIVGILIVHLIINRILKTNEQHQR